MLDRTESTIQSENFAALSPFKCAGETRIMSARFIAQNLAYSSVVSRLSISDERFVGDGSARNALACLALGSSPGKIKIQSSNKYTVGADRGR